MASDDSAPSMAGTTAAASGGLSTSTGYNMIGGFDKLEGITNFQTWKFAMKNYLILDGLWTSVTGEDNNPVRSQRALARISLCMKPNLFQLLYGIDTAKDAWNKLATVYEDKGLFRRVSLLRQLHRVEFTAFANMTAYIDYVFTLVQQLANIGKLVEDAEIAELLLSGLPQEFDTLVSALETASITSGLSSELVRARLLQEEYRKTNTESNGTGSSLNNAFAANSFKVKKIICHFCKKPGHIKSKCYKWKRLKKQDYAKEEQTMMVSTFYASAKTDFIVDSGSTSHMCNNDNMFVDLKSNKVIVNCADKMAKLESSGMGSVYVSINGATKILKDVMYIPQLTENLLSVSKMCERGLVVVFRKDGCFIYDECTINGKYIMSAELNKGVYRMKGTCILEQSMATLHQVQGSQTARLAVSNLDADLWHRRLGHLSMKGMDALMKNTAHVISFQADKDHLQQCTACLKGKPVAKAYPTDKASRASQLLELIHSDVLGPMSDDSWGGARYLLTLTDDYSRKSFGYLMKKKSEVFSNFVIFKTLVEKQTGFHVKCLRSDNGGEYCSKEFTTYLQKEGVLHQLTVPYSAPQNGVAERLNRNVMEKARCMLLQAGLCKRFWGEAIMTAIYLKNRSPTAALAGQLPEETWSGHKVRLDHLRVFGCIAYSLIPEPTRTSKLNARSKMCIFVGYSETTKGYRLVEPSNPRGVYFSRNVDFIENKFYKDFKCIDMINKNFINEELIVCSAYNNELNDHLVSETYSHEINQNETDSNEKLTCDIDNAMNEMNHTYDFSYEFTDAETGSSEPDIELSVEELEAQPASSGEMMARGEEATSTGQASVTVGGRSLRSNRGKPPIRYDDYEMSMFTSSIFDEPQSYEQAMSSSNSNKWTNAMRSEYESLLKNNVWKLVDRPENTNVVKCKWVYKVKHDASGNFDRFKARLVARGFSQKEGLDFSDTFSPVVRHSTMRILFSLAHHYDMSMEHIDVTTAFLHGDLNEIIYMEQPPGFGSDESKVCFLSKCIYGLKQASRMWNLKVHQQLTKNGYVQNKCEPCVYVRRNFKDLTIIALYVDDFYILSTCDTDNLCKLLENSFSIKHLGPLKSCLGMRLSRDKNVLKLDQTEYVKRLLKRFNMLECKTVSTPMVSNNKLFKSESESLDDNFYQYRQLVGCLMYLSVCTRPDITFSCSQLSQYLTNFDKSHWVAAKRVLRYLAGTIDRGLCFYKCANLSIEAYADADWANDMVDRKSYTGFVVKLGKDVVSWESRKQRCVALSSTEAEYVAICDVAKELCFIRNFLYEIIDKRLSIVIFNDNQSAQKLLLAKEYAHRRTKHIDLRYHFIKDVIQKYNITIRYVPTDDMTADIFTKALCFVKHNNFVSSLNLS